MSPLWYTNSQEDALTIWKSSECALCYRKIFGAMVLSGTLGYAQLVELLPVMKGVFIFLCRTYGRNWTCASYRLLQH